jgi:isopentenyl diphosphate isomerase/L-lactate dehydrogenase-like FMN-dependent dehydrogenase
VLVGRPVLWGLAVDGQAGVERVLEMLGGELRRTLALLGRASVRAVDASVLTEIQGLVLPPR